MNKHKACYIMRQNCSQRN